MNKISKIIGIVVIIAILVGAGIYFSKRQPQIATQNQNNNSQTSGSTPNVATPDGGANKDSATAGKLIAGFPPGLIIENNVTFTESYKEDFGDTAHQYTAKYTSTKTPKDLYKLYTDYFTKNSYTISNTLNSDTIAAIYATKGDTTVNFNASKISTTASTQVVISYLVSTAKK